MSNTRIMTPGTRRVPRANISLLHSTRAVRSLRAVTERKTFAVTTTSVSAAPKIAPGTRTNAVKAALAAPTFKVARIASARWRQTTTRSAVPAQARRRKLREIETQRTKATEPRRSRVGGRRAAAPVPGSRARNLERTERMPRTLLSKTHRGPAEDDTRPFSQATRG